MSKPWSSRAQILVEMGRKEEASAQENSIIITRPSPEDLPCKQKYYVSKWLALCPSVAPSSPVPSLANSDIRAFNEIFSVIEDSTLHEAAKLLPEQQLYSKDTTDDFLPLLKRKSLSDSDLTESEKKRPRFDGKRGLEKAAELLPGLYSKDRSTNDIKPPLKRKSLTETDSDLNEIERNKRPRFGNEKKELEKAAKLLPGLHSKNRSTDDIKPPLKRKSLTDFDSNTLQSKKVKFP